MTPRSRTVDDGRMADQANVTWSLVLAELVLSLTCRTPHKVCLRWIQLQAVGRHPLCDVLHAVC